MYLFIFYCFSYFSIDSNYFINSSFLLGKHILRGSGIHFLTSKEAIERILHEK